MIYVTCTTRNRFWHSALTALSIINSNCTDCFIEVIDDASSGKWSNAKHCMFLDLAERGLVQSYTKFSQKLGFCRGREFLIQRFLSEDSFTHWFHLDDDILIGQGVIQQAVEDLEVPLAGQGLLHVYANPWCTYSPTVGPFATVTKIGGACFLVKKDLLVKLGQNPYTNQTNGEEANARWWASLRRSGYSMFIRWTKPYQCQHTGNVDSTIFGYTPSWESLFAKDLRTGRIVDVKPFPLDRLRRAIKSRDLSAYVRSQNVICSQSLRLCTQETKTEHSIRSTG